ncbi:MAG TPA: type II toxin-antitoxin system VapC family toxin [Candidatus Limnocylindrales bacterium]|nr:type II toxin-antitoxin system VapC family toxin [Candidatus Limnocylindrales bacterium]
MRFWDSSAIVPLLVEQRASARAAAWLSEDGAVVLWTLSPVEVVSALRRLVREDAIPEDVARRAETRLDDLISVSHQVVDVQAVKGLATRLLRAHALRAFDALQLGAALHWAEAPPRGRTVHTFDGRLAQAARREGFAVPD